MENRKPIIAYKGFNKDWTCRGFQYKVGQSYETDKAVKICQSGFHACEHPLDVFSYYAPNSSVFAIVEFSSQIEREDNGDTKIASASITIKSEIHIHEMVEAAVKYVFDAAKWVKGNAATGDQGAASATGDQGAASATGYQGKALAGEGNAIFLLERDDEGEIISVFAGIAGKNGVKPDTWYTLVNGELIEEK